MSAFKPGPRQTKWIESLRSGKYDKGTARLHRNDKYCCLGVACKVFKDELSLVVGKSTEGITYNEHDSAAPPILVEYLGLRNNQGRAKTADLNNLVTLNDETFEDDINFNNVADYIEKHAEHYFKESL